MSYGNGGEYDRSSRPSNPNAVGSTQPQPRKSNALWWILGILGCVAVVGAFVCCGGGYFAYRFSTEMVGTIVKDAVAQDPAIEEHIGTIQTIDVNLGATGEAGGGNRMVFDVRGDKGSGQIEAVLSPGGQSLDSAVLVLPDGERIDLELQEVDLQETDIQVPEEDGQVPDAEGLESDPLMVPEAEPAPEAEPVPSEADVQ